MKPSKMVALSAVSASLAALLVTIGNATGILDISMFLLASIALMIPLVYGSYLGSFLAFLASFLIGFMFVPNIVTMVPYLVFFGPYIFIAHFLKSKNIKMVFQILIKCLFFGVAVFVIYKTTTLVVDVDSFLSKYVKLPTIALLGLGIAVLFIYDFLMVRIKKHFDFLVRRILR